LLNSGKAATLIADKMKIKEETSINNIYFLKFFFITFLNEKFDITKNNNPEKKEALLKVKKIGNRSAPVKFKYTIYLSSFKLSLSMNKQKTKAAKTSAPFIN
tara:strand:+ start:61 stop:366 length:306 start_codon:yes stop_codon:yes gene_type:complete